MVQSGEGESKKKKGEEGKKRNWEKDKVSVGIKTDLIRLCL